MPDDYDVHGTWKLDNFPEVVDAWQKSDERPPFKLVADVNAWWPRLERADQRARAVFDEDEGLFVMWVPGCYLLDDEVMLGVLCFFRVEDIGHKVICEGLHLAPERRPPSGFGE